MSRSFAVAVVLAACVSGCTAYHSRQALFDPAAPAPANDARFVEEEDSGFALFGVLVFSEPEHYAVLMERARRRHHCARLTHAELEFFTDHWVLVGFPIARVTALCEPAARATARDHREPAATAAASTPPTAEPTDGGVPAADAGAAPTAPGTN